ncbi:hypothetical protein DVK00_18850 [Haloarcula sp. Atlit-47R]|uniref:hypothetical protein n=1 Tax=Haloarcula sp. Atlit-47R TaxID=2282132 RepID=UPI000EF28F0A|nr:hypothetical protein [Haloarcula sp. Atlit-47R]RLM41899.1 hypothetical protein DVK00_18850 [Haloarcula sp. Atlit-47R]
MVDPVESRGPQYSPARIGERHLEHRRVDGLATGVHDEGAYPLGPFVAGYDTGVICGYCSYESYFSHRHRNNLKKIAVEQSVYLPPA